MGEYPDEVEESIEAQFREFKRRLEHVTNDDQLLQDMETTGAAYKAMGIERAEDLPKLETDDRPLRFYWMAGAGMYEFLNGDAEAAIEAFQEAVDTPGLGDNERIGASYYLALSLEQAGRIEEAMELLERLKVEAPSDTEISKAMERLRDAPNGGSRT